MLQSRSVEQYKIKTLNIQTAKVYSITHNINHRNIIPAIQISITSRHCFHKSLHMDTILVRAYTKHDVPHLLIIRVGGTLQLAWPSGVLSLKITRGGVITINTHTSDIMDAGHMPGTWSHQSIGNLIGLNPHGGKIPNHEINNCEHTWQISCSFEISVPDPTQLYSTAVNRYSKCQIFSSTC